jgi:hypothetical protein
MKKTTIGILAAIFVILGLGVGLMLQHQRNADLARRFSKLEGQLLRQSAKVAAQGTLLDGANVELESLRKAAKEREAASVLAATEPDPSKEDRTAEAELERVKAEVIPPVVTVNRGATAYVFPQLKDAKGNVVLTNAEFGSLFGRRLAFRVAGGPRAFDVDELHPGVLAYLGIDPEATKQKYALQKQREQIQQMTDAVARKQAFRQWEEHMAKLAVEQAKAAVEREKSAAYRTEQVRVLQQASNDRLKVWAAERQADAAERQASATEQQLKDVRHRSGISTTFGSDGRSWTTYGQPSGGSMTFGSDGRSWTTYGQPGGGSMTFGSDGRSLTTYGH